MVLPVYNGADYLDEAIESILGQTWQHWELLLINDGSKDRSLEILRSYKDPRIHVIDQANMGLSATLNKGIGLARGTYIARQDQDDISLPRRLEEQVRFMESHPTVGMAGCHARIIGLDGKVIGAHRHPAGNAELKFFLLYNNPFVHSSIMFRKEMFSVTGQYSTDPQRQPPEDYELFSRVARGWDMANIPEILHVYREVKTSMSRDKNNPFLPKILLISAENIAQASQRTSDDPLVMETAAFLNGVRSPGQKNSLKDMKRLLSGIIESYNTDPSSARRLRSRVRILFIKAVLKIWLRKTGQ